MIAEHILLPFACVEITAFSDRHAEFDKINTEILGVSVDSVVSGKAIAIARAIYYA